MTGTSTAAGLEDIHNTAEADHTRKVEAISAIEKAGLSAELVAMARAEIEPGRLALRPVYVKSAEARVAFQSILKEHNDQFPPWPVAAGRWLKGLVSGLLAAPSRVTIDP